MTALCYTDGHLPAFSISVHGKAQTPVVRFVVDMFYKQTCNKFTSNQWVWALMYSKTSVYRHTGPYMRQTEAPYGPHCWTQL